MGIVSKFERTLQGAVGDAFARLFGGKVVAAEVESQLRKRAEASLKTVDGHKLVSNSYTIVLARSDYESFTEDERLAVKTFSRHLADHIAEQGWETYGPVTVSFVQREGLHTGQFRVDERMDPDAVPFQVSAAAPAPAPGHSTPSSPGGYPAPQEYAPMPPSNNPFGGAPAAQPAYGQDQYSQAQYGQSQFSQDRYDQPGYQVGHEQPGQNQYEPAQQYPPAGSDQPNPFAAQQAGQGDSRTQVTQGRQARSVTLILEDGSGRTFRLQQGSNLIGRGQDASFRLPDTGVSRQHVDVHFDGREAVLSDLGSTNGTTVNGGPVQDWQLADGDVIRIGHSEIMVRFD